MPRKSAQQKAAADRRRAVAEMRAAWAASAREDSEESEEEYTLGILAAGDPESLCRPCVTCGRFTGRFCDGANGKCLAVRRLPKGDEIMSHWPEGMATPLCSTCEEEGQPPLWAPGSFCHFCLAIPWCRQPAWRQGEPAQARANGAPEGTSLRKPVESESEDDDEIIRQARSPFFGARRPAPPSAQSWLNEMS